MILWALYLTSSSSVESKFVLACVLDTDKLFQLHGLKTSLLVCDDGSSNIATIKASHGQHGAYYQCPVARPMTNTKLSLECQILLIPPTKSFGLYALRVINNQTRMALAIPDLTYKGGIA